MAPLIELVEDEPEVRPDDETLDENYYDEEVEEIHLSEDDAAFIDNVITRCLVFLEEFCDVKLFPYQTQIAYRVMESVFIGDGEVITVEQARQSGKSEVLANVIATLMVLLPRLAKAYPKRFGKFAKGFLVGCFAPTDEQADTVWGRVVDRLTSDKATEMLLDPELEDKVTKQGGKSKTVTLKTSRSLCRRQTCNPKAKIESKTYHFVLIDEAQDADSFVVEKSIGPMLAFSNGSRVYTGTPTRTKNVFYKTIQQNKRRQLKRGVRQNHFSFDYKYVCRYNTNYRAYIAKEKARLGEDSDEFQLSYCVSPSTKVLTADLRYIPAGDVAAGMRLVGFDEERPGKGLHRQFRETEVLAADLIERPCYAIELSDGTVLTCSAEHRWLVSTAGRRTEWKTTESLLPSDRIFKVADVWDAAERSYGTGYLAAAFDGEGCLNRRPDGKIVGLTFAQRDNAMMAEVRKLLDERGYEYTLYEHHSNNGVVHLNLRGGQAAVLRFLGEIRPLRLLGKFSADALGSIGRHDHKGQDFEHPRVVRVSDVGTQPVMAIKTTTKTYVAEGLASHNCCKWLIDQGMFVTEDVLNEMADNGMRVHRYWYKSKVLVGVDPARTKDSTVVTVVWVDWDHPDPFGLYEHRVLAWLELHNQEWEKQYYHIVEFLSHYNILRIGVDTTGMGSAVYERLKLLFPDVDVIECPSDSKTQSARWKHLKTLMERRMFVFPAHSTARRTRPWKKFFQQMTDLETKFQGPYMLAEAPDEVDAHDDYADSAAIACSLSLVDVLEDAQSFDTPWASRNARASRR